MLTNLWIKIENAINKVLTSIGIAIMSGIIKILPERFVRLHRKLRDAIQSRKAELGNKSDQFIAKIQSKANEKINQIKEADLKGKALKKKDETIKKAKGLTPKLIILGIIPFLKKPFINLFAWLSSIKPATLALGMAMTIVVGTAGLGVAKSGGRIAKRKASRQPSSYYVDPSVASRPKYYKAQRKQTLMQQIRLPVYSEGRRSIKILTIDFTLEASNRTVIHFINGHRHYFKDHLLSTIEPITPTFILEDEGKRVIKEKIQNEFNSFLKKKKLEGEITAVYMDTIIAK